MREKETEGIRPKSFAATTAAGEEMDFAF